MVVTHDRRFITPDDLVLEIQDGELASESGLIVDHSAAFTHGDMNKAYRPFTDA